MPSERARELAWQLVAQADLILDQMGQMDEVPVPSEQGVDGKPSLRGFIRAPGVALFLNVVLVGSTTAGIALALASGPRQVAGFGGTLMRLSAAWALAYAPAWLIVRFFTERLPLIRDKYVEQLHRLRVDDPGSLPKPRPGSPYFAAWLADGGRARLGQPSIYEEKFSRHYGASLSRAAKDRTLRIPVEALLPTFVMTAVFSIGWTAILWHAAPVDTNGSTTPIWVSLGAAFLGAYTVGVNTLVRRFFTNELRATTAAEVTGYVILVVAVALALHAVLASLGVDPPVTAAIMLALGLLSRSGTRLLKRLTVTLLRSSVPSIGPTHPLTELDGMNVWYESRLLEEGIEDLTGLVSAPVVDVILHAQVPVARLVDWIDQALLFTHLDEGSNLRQKLRHVGIRSATDLLEVFPPQEMESRVPQSKSTRAALNALGKSEVEEGTLRGLVRTVANATSLRLVENWRNDQVAQSSATSRPARDRDAPREERRV